MNCGDKPIKQPKLKRKCKTWYDGNGFWLVSISYQYSVVSVSYDFQYFVLVLLFYCILSYYSDVVLCTITDITFLWLHYNQNVAYSDVSWK